MTKMGRPPIGKHAMTGAERVRRHREAKKKEKVRTEQSTAFRYRRPVTKQDRETRAEVAKLRRQLAQAADEITRLKAAQAAIEPSSMMAKRKLDAAIRLHKKQLDDEYNQRRMKEIAEHIDRIMPTLQQEKNDAFEREQTYRRYMDQQKKIFTIAEYRKIMMCIHSDESASKKTRDEASFLFTAKKFALTGEK